MKKYFVLIAALIVTINLVAQDENFHIYLCFGQSNMQGSAEIEPQDTVPMEGYLMMAPTDFDKLGRKLGKWYPAIPPLSRPNASLSPADYFGRAMKEAMGDDVKIGVINVAVSGCDIRLFDQDLYLDYYKTHEGDWFSKLIDDIGGDPYHRLVHLARLAQRDGVIKGIILHQGETNNGQKGWCTYVAKIYRELLDDINMKAEDVPLLAGETAHKDQNGTCALHNTVIATLPEHIPTAHVVSSKGCEVRKDNVHFNSVGVRELGRRYAKKMLEVKGY